MTQKSDIETAFRRHYATMYRLAIAIVHDHESARDIVHDTFEALINGGINDVSVGYLLNAVKNRCYNRVREFNTHQRIEELIRLECDDTTDDWPDEQTFADIRETVGKVLTESAQKIVRMRFYEGYSCKEIAKELSISENSVYKSLRNAVLTIRKKLSYNG